MSLAYKFGGKKPTECSFSVSPFLGCKERPLYSSRDGRALLRERELLFLYALSRSLAHAFLNLALSGLQRGLDTQCALLGTEDCDSKAAALGF